MGGLEKRTALHFPILFVKDFGNLEDKGVGVGVGFFQNSLVLEDAFCEWSLSRSQRTPRLGNESKNM